MQNYKHAGVTHNCLLKCHTFRKCARIDKVLRACRGNHLPPSGDSMRAYLANSTAPISCATIAWPKSGRYESNRLLTQTPKIGTSRPQQLASVLDTATRVAVFSPPTSICPGRCAVQDAKPGPCQKQTIIGNKGSSEESWTPEQCGPAASSNNGRQTSGRSGEWPPLAARRECCVHQRVRRAGLRGRLARRRTRLGAKPADIRQALALSRLISTAASAGLRASPNSARKTPRPRTVAAWNHFRIRSWSAPRLSSALSAAATAKPPTKSIGVRHAKYALRAAAVGFTAAVGLLRLCARGAGVSGAVTMVEQQQQGPSVGYSLCSVCNRDSMK